MRATRQHLKSMAPYLATAESEERHRELLLALYGLIMREVVPDRPNRVEPRVRKRRPKHFSLMTRPRAVLKRELLANG
jgi:hypothetical protein